MRKILLSLAVLVSMTACSSPGGVTLTYGDKENPGRVTAVSGLKSRDAAHLASQSAYYDAKIRTPQKAIVSIKAREGQQITMSGVEEFTVWAPSTEDDRVAQPAPIQSEFAENIRALGAATRDVMSGAAPIVGILEGAKTVRNGQNAGLEAQRINAESNRAIAGQGIDAASKPPLVVGAPAGGAEVIYPRE